MISPCYLTLLISLFVNSSVIAQPPPVHSPSHSQTSSEFDWKSLLNFDEGENSKPRSTEAFPEKKKVNNFEGKTLKNEKSNEIKSLQKEVKRIKGMDDVSEYTKNWRLGNKEEFKRLSLSEQNAIRENRRINQKNYRARCKERYGYSCASNARFAELRRLVNSGKATIAQKEIVEEQRRRERASKVKGRKRQREALKQDSFTSLKRPFPH